MPRTKPRVASARSLPGSRRDGKQGGFVTAVNPGKLSERVLIGLADVCGHGLGIRVFLAVVNDARGHQYPTEVGAPDIAWQLELAAKKRSCRGTLGFVPTDLTSPAGGF
jgi:hypothetical protein